MRNWLEYLPFITVAKLVRALPRHAALVLGRRLGLFARWLQPRRQKIARDNLARAFPEKSNDFFEYPPFKWVFIDQLIILFTNSAAFSRSFLSSPLMTTEELDISLVSSDRKSPFTPIVLLKDWSSALPASRSRIEDNR